MASFLSRMFVRGMLAMPLGIIVQFLMTVWGVAFFHGVSLVHNFLISMDDGPIWIKFLFFHAIGWALAFFALRDQEKVARSNEQAHTSVSFTEGLHTVQANIYVN